MANWQYAWMTDQPYTTIGFSHPQSGLASELAAVLGAGVLMQQSNEWSISLDRSRVNLGYVSGLMGDRGWEMFAVETRLQPNAMTPAQLQTNWYFKKPGPDKPATVSVAAASSAAPMAAPAQPASPVISTYGQPAVAAPAAPAAAPAWSTPAAPAAPASSPEMAPQAAPTTPEMPAPAAPAAPPGPEAAPISGADAPPPGPGGYTPSGG